FRSAKRADRLGADARFPEPRFRIDGRRDDRGDHGRAGEAGRQAGCGQERQGKVARDAKKEIEEGDQEVQGQGREEIEEEGCEESGKEGKEKSCQEGREEIEESREEIEEAAVILAIVPAEQARSASESRDCPEVN